MQLSRPYMEQYGVSECLWMLQLSKTTCLINKIIQKHPTILRNSRLCSSSLPFRPPQTPPNRSAADLRNRHAARTLPPEPPAERPLAARLVGAFLGAARRWAGGSCTPSSSTVSEGCRVAGRRRQPGQGSIETHVKKNAIHCHIVWWFR